jgi:hypothetical protein
MSCTTVYSKYDRSFSLIRIFFVLHRDYVKNFVCKVFSQCIINSSLGVGVGEPELQEFGLLGAVIRLKKARGHLGQANFEEPIYTSILHTQP